MFAASHKQSVMTLYSGSTDPYSHGVRLVLAEKGIHADIVDINKATKVIEELNPYGTTPTLVDRDLILYQPGIIAEYLDERFPHPPLLPVSPVARARSRLMIYRVNRDWYTLMDKIRLAEEESVGLVAIRKDLNDSITSIAAVFSEYPFFFSDEFSLIDCYIAPVLWRLPMLGVILSPQAKSVLAYAERLFKRDAFLASLTEAEQAMRR